MAQNYAAQIIQVQTQNKSEDDQLILCYFDSSELANLVKKD